MASATALAIFVFVVYLPGHGDSVEGFGLQSHTRDQGQARHARGDQYRQLLRSRPPSADAESHGAVSDRGNGPDLQRSAAGDLIGIRSRALAGTAGSVSWPSLGHDSRLNGFSSREQEKRPAASRIAS